MKLTTLPNLLLTIVLIIALVGCRNKKEITTTTLTTTVEKIDTIITIPKDSMTLVAPLQSLITPRIIDNGVQRVVLSFDPQTNNVSVKAEVLERDVTIQKEVTTTTEKKEKKREVTAPDREPKKLGFWQKVKRGINLILVFLIGFVVAWFFKPFIKRLIFG